MDYHLYADGACSGNPGPGGYAWMVFDSIAMEDQEPVMRNSGGATDTTNNAMELHALLDALKHLHDEGVVPDRIHFHLDSEYVLKGAFTWLPGWKKRGWRTSGNGTLAHAETWREVDRLMTALRRRGIALVPSGVKGHSGDPGNEMVDREAARLRDSHKPTPTDGEKWTPLPGQRVRHRRGGDYLVLRNAPLRYDGWRDEQEIRIRVTGDSRIEIEDDHGKHGSLLVMVQRPDGMEIGTRENWVLYLSLHGPTLPFLRPEAEFVDGRFHRIGRGG